MIMPGFKTRLMAPFLALGIAFSAYGQEPRIRDGYVPLDHCLKKKAGISHYFVRGHRVGVPGDNFYNIMIPKERIDTPGLAISGLQPDAPYKIIISACDKEGDCTEDGYIVRQARARRDKP